MVENNKHLESAEYSDGMEDEEYSSDDNNDEYSDQSDEQDYDEYDEEDGNAQPKKKKSPLPLILLFAGLIVVIIVVLMMKLGGGAGQGGESMSAGSSQNQSFEQNQNTENVMPQDNNQQPEQASDNLADSFFSEAGGENNNPDNQNMMSVNFNESGETNVAVNPNPEQNGNDQVATVSDASSQNTAKESDLFDTQSNPETTNEQENNAIMVVYNKAARTNPFKPPVTAEKAPKDVPFELINNTQFEIIEPPKESVADENLTKLLQTQISGILYDTVSPSAIVNLNGLDHFVKVGDTISGYTIKSITKDKVQITYKNNSYVASVGELFSPGDLAKQQSVANLQNKFAGRYKN